MSDRTKGLLNISANFEVQSAEGLDSRCRVKTKASLILLDTWKSTDNNAYTYVGMLVTVYEDVELNNGVYRLKSSDYSIMDNWEKVSGDPFGNSGELQLNSGGTLYSTSSLTYDFDNNILNVNLLSASTYYGDGSHLTGLVATLSGLTDVSLNNLFTGEILIYSGNTWKNNTLDFNYISNKPTTLVGYGITDAVLLSEYNTYTGITVPSLIQGINNNLTAHTSLTGSTNPHITSFFDLTSTAHTHLKSMITNFVEGDYVHTTGNENIYGDKTFENNVTVRGNVHIIGTATTIYAEDLSIKDNLITINSGETNSGVTKGYAGIEVDRGQLTNYVFIFDENQGNFRIGQTETLTANTQAVATREDSPISSGISFWNANEYRFDTSNKLTWNGNKLFISGNVSANTYYGDGSNLTGLVATLSGLTDVILNTLVTGNTIIFSGGSWKNINQPWEYINNKPTTISGYGITDAVLLSTYNSYTANTYNTLTSITYNFNYFTGVTAPNTYVNVSGDIMSGNLTISTLSGTSSLRAAYLNSAGTLIIGDEIGDFYITATTIVTALQLESNWNNTIFIGATDLSSLANGQKYLDSAYTYEYSNNTMYRNSANIQSTASTFFSSNYYTKTQSDIRYVNVTGDTMTGNLNLPELSATTVSATTFYGTHLWTDLDNRFVYTNLSSNTIIDSFASSLTDGCHWNYVVRSGVNVEAGTIIGVWDYVTSAKTYTQYSTDSLGNTNAITFNIQITNNNVELVTNITSGSWNIKIRRLSI